MKTTRIPHRSCGIPTRALLLAIALVALGTAQTADADIGPPVEIHVVGDPNDPPIEGASFQSTLRIRAGAEVALADIGLGSPRDPVTQQRGWTALTLQTSEPDLAIAAGDSIDVDWSALCVDATQPVVFSFLHNGKRFERHLYLLPPAVRSLDQLSATGDPSKFVGAVETTVVEPSPEALAALRDDAARRDDEDRVVPTKGRSIRVRGRFLYRRDVVQMEGVRGATVRIKDADFGFDDELGVDTTDSNGEFDVTFWYDQGEDPDIYAEIEMRNSKFELEIPGWQNNNYKYHTSEVSNYKGQDLVFPDFGFDTTHPDRPLGHLMTWYSRASDWLGARGFGNIQRAGVWFPDGSNSFYSSWTNNIHIAWKHRWEEGVYFHEYGHHWVHQYATQGGTNYCNAGGWCDDPGDCGHCAWCPETGVDAWREGFPNWLSDAIGRTFDSQFTPGLLHPKSYETIAPCTDGGADFFADPYLTEGFLAALLRDIDDGVDPNDSPDFSPDWGDPMDLNTQAILHFVDDVKPSTPLQFVIGFLGEVQGQGYSKQQYWEVLANNGYEFADTNPPGATPSIVSNSHVVGVANPDATVQFTWDPAPDDFSGPGGYAVLVSNSSDEMPSPSLDTVAPQWFTGYLQPGTYWIHVRAVDRAGNWSAVKTSFGPIVIDEPTPPDLGVDTHPRGWALSLVPSNTTSATATSVPEPDFLLGTSPTYFNLAIHNSGGSSPGPGWPTRLFLDGELIGSWSTGFTQTVPAFGSKLLNNWNPTNVRGGRHMLEAVTDPDESHAEVDEADNRTARQWVWRGDLLTSADPVEQRPAPPDPLGGFTQPVPLFTSVNCDGLRLGPFGERFIALAARPLNPGDDYDLRLHPVGSGPLAGFELLSVLDSGGWSSRGPGEVDAVIAQHPLADSITNLWEVGVTNENGGGGDYVARFVDASLLPFGATQTLGLDADVHFALYEIEPGGGNDGSIQVELSTAPANGPLHMALFGPDFVSGDLEDADLSAVTDAQGRMTLLHAAPFSGVWGLAVWRDPKDHPTAPALSFALTASTVPANARPMVPNGWAGAVIPRPLADGTSSAVALPESLLGDVPSTWVNLAWENAGSQTIDLALVDVMVDGVAIDQLGWGPVPGGDDRSWNAGVPLTVPGGRHTLAMRLDPTDLVVETDETDNVGARQWAWRAATLVPGPSVARAAPPLATGSWPDLLEAGQVGGFHFDLDGLRVPAPDPIATEEFWQVMAVMPAAGTDVDLALYRAEDSPTSGFTYRRASSARGPGTLDYVGVSFRATSPRDFDLGIGDPTGNGGPYVAQVARGRSLGVVANGVFGPYAMGPDAIVDVIEMRLEQGVTNVRVVDVGPEPVDWGFAVHRSDLAYHEPVTALNDATAFGAGVGEAESATFVVPSTGDYAVVVYKVSSSERGKDGAWELQVNGSVTDVDGPVVVARIDTIREVRPNPFNPRTEIRFEVATEQRVRLEIYNVRGEKVRTLIDGARNAGEQRVVWDGVDDEGRRVASGVYLLRLSTARGVEQRKLTLLK